MTEEGTNAIRRARELLKETTFITDIGHKDLETLLNLIQKQQEEIEKKDKMIDEMAEAISKYTPPNEEFDFCGKTIFECQESDKNKDCKECVKQYFERKAEV